MRFPGRLYLGKEGTYLALYNHYPDIWMACPDSLEAKADRLAHIIYRWGGHNRAIDVFRLRSVARDIPEIKLAPPINLNRRGIQKVDVRQDVQYEIKKGAPKELSDIARRDIANFIETKKDSPPAKNPQGTRVNKVLNLIPVTQIKYIHPWKNRILTPGKQEFVPQCGNYANIDFTKGCVTSLISDGKAVLDLTQSEVRGVYIAPWRECDYCYAQNKHKPALKNIYLVDWDQLKEELLGKARLTTGSDKQFGRKVERLRFGKRTEAASLLTRPQFLKTLEICAETGTQGVIPTKFLEYDKETAKLLRRTNSVVIYAAGWDEFQRGACSWGCTTDWELEQAVKYGEDKVNSAIYFMVANPVAEPSERDRKIIAFIEKNKKNLVGTQLLPMRFKSKKLAEQIAGIHWDDAKSDRGLFTKEGDCIGCYEIVGGELNPTEFNEFWLNLIGNNNGFYRMCHHTNEKVWCGGCFTKKGFTIQHKRVSVSAVKKIPRPSNRKNRKIKTIPAVEKYQLDFF